MILFRRGTSTQRLLSEQVLESGQPFYETDTKNIFVGDGITLLKNLKCSTVTNIENGVGLHSLIQKTAEGEENSTAPADETIGSEQAIAFGKKCKATNKRSVAIGNGVTSTGNASFGIGQTTNVSGSGAFIGGNGGTVSGNYSIGFGGGGNTSGNYSANFGSTNTLAGDYSGTIGSANSVQGQCSFSAGQNANVYDDFGIALGQGVFVGSGDGTRQNQMAVGRYNNAPLNALFIVGKGDDDYHRSNAFEVYKNGRAKLYGVPQDPEDIVRKQELDTKLTFTSTSGSMPSTAKIGDINQDSATTSTYNKFFMKTASNKNSRIALFDSLPYDDTAGNALLTYAAGKFGWTWGHNFASSADLANSLTNILKFMLVGFVNTSLDVTKTSDGRVTDVTASDSGLVKSSATGQTIMLSPGEAFAAYQLGYSTSQLSFTGGTWQESDPLWLGDLVIAVPYVVRSMGGGKQGWKVLTNEGAAVYTYNVSSTQSGITINIPNDAYYYKKIKMVSSSY